MADTDELKADARAIFMAARILQDRLEDAEGAARMYGFLVQNYPDHDLAHHANEQLRKLA